MIHGVDGKQHLPVTITEPAVREALRASESALRRMANYQLLDVLDRRILDLGERKESLTGDERAELFAWVTFTRQRSLDKLEADVALKRISKAWPDAVNSPLKP